MGGLFGVSFYKIDKIPTKDGYRQESMDGGSLPWKWFVSQKTGECVRAFLIDGRVLACEGMRVLAASIGKAPAVYDVPAGLMLVHDLERVWAVTQEYFDAEFCLASALVVEISTNS